MGVADGSHRPTAALQEGLSSHLGLSGAEKAPGLMGRWPHPVVPCTESDPGPEASQGPRAGYCGGDVGAGGQTGAHEPARKASFSLLHCGTGLTGRLAMKELASPRRAPDGLTKRGCGVLRSPQALRGLLRRKPAQCGWCRRSPDVCRGIRRGPVPCTEESPLLRVMCLLGMVSKWISKGQV